jgi:thioesterase domain-containing protein/acyl carrier protein
MGKKFQLMGKKEEKVPAQGSPLTPCPLGPRDVVEEQLAAIWSEVLDIPQVHLQDNFFDLGGTSLETSLVAVRIKKAFGREIGLNAFFEAPTVEKLAAVLRNHPDIRIPRVVVLREKGSRPPLFCFPGGAGNVIAMRDLFLRLPADQRVYGIEGLPLKAEISGASEASPNGNAPVQARVEEIAAAHLADIRKIQPRGPYYLVGLCFGALVIFEMARQLVAQGEEVAFVGLLDPPVPGLTRRANNLSSLRQALGRLMQKSWSQRRETVKNTTFMIGEKLGAHLTRQLLALLPAKKVSSKLLARKPLILQAVLHYAPSPYAGTLSILLVKENGLGQNEYAEKQWRKLAAKVEIDIIPGDHGNFFHEPHAAITAERLMYFLEPAQERYGSTDSTQAVGIK